VAQRARGTPHITAATQAPWHPPVAHEQPCFPIHRLELHLTPGSGGGEDAQGFGWLLRELDAFTGGCLGAASLEALRANLDQRLAHHGLVTSHVTLPEQNLTQGTVRLQLLLGMLATLAWRTQASATAGAAEKASPGDAVRNALAAQVGHGLNLRDIEQTLENLSRLPSQAVQFQIEPGEKAGTSVLAMMPIATPGSAQARRWRMSAGLDNAAAREYGRWQTQLQAAVDTPLGLADQLQLSSTRTLAQAGSASQQASYQISYFVPWGYQALQLSASGSRHARPIQGISTRFTENGFDTTHQARLQTVAWRSASSRWLLWGGATQRRARNHVDDVELILQRRRTPGACNWGGRKPCGMAWPKVALPARTAKPRPSTTTPPWPGPPCARPPAEQIFKPWAAAGRCAASTPKGSSAAKSKSP
jgi:hemolysin activation/secretion protein